MVFKNFSGVLKDLAMEPKDNKDIKSTQDSRRAFLMKAGFAGVPLLMSFKSQATWGTTSLNCGLSATASQIASLTAASGKTCKEEIVHNICDVDYFNNPHGCFRKPSAKVHKYGSVEICQDTKFKHVFGGSKSTKFKDCIAASTSNFERNMTYCFLYAFYLEKVKNSFGSFPSASEFVNAYQRASGKQRDDLVRLVAFYVNGY